MTHKKIPNMMGKTVGSQDRYQLKESLGSGGYSIVHRAIDVSTSLQHEVAIKVMRHHNARDAQKFEAEVSLHSRACHLPGVVQVHDSFTSGDLGFIVLEYFPDGDLFTAIMEREHYDEQGDLIKKAFLQLVDTVHSLHKLGIYHRDLKPDNIMCNKDGSKVWITDFGLATDQEVTADFGCGSSFYMSPECLAGRYTSALRGYSSRAADIWALAIILVNLITRRLPWKKALLTTDWNDPFNVYTTNHWSLYNALPLSKDVFEVINLVLAKHGNNICLKEIYKQVERIDTFHMIRTEENKVILEDPYAEALAERNAQPTAYPPKAVFIISDSGADKENSDFSLSPVPSDIGRTDSDSLSFSSLPDSEGPITPETNAVDIPNDSIPELPELAMGRKLCLTGEDTQASGAKIVVAGSVPSKIQSKAKDAKITVATALAKLTAKLRV